MNKKLDNNIESFLMSNIENQIISSKFVKEIARLKGNVNKFLTKSLKNVKKKLMKDIIKYILVILIYLQIYMERKKYDN